jgi:hypothetical protein
MARITVLSPVPAAAAAHLAAPAFPRSLAGRTVGFIDNNKANFDRLVGDMTVLLTEQHGVKRVVHRKKANASTPAPPEILAELAKECDLVLAGSGD